MKYVVIKRDVIPFEKKVRAMLQCLKKPDYCS
jgi:hypothetical protein